MTVPRIRIAVGTIYPFDETTVRGGPEAIALYLTKALAKRADVDLHVVACNAQAPRSFTERRHGATFHWLATGERLYGLRSVTMNTWRVRAAYRRIQPDLVHAQNCPEYVLGAPRQTPVLYTLHGVEVFAGFMRSAAHYRGLVGAYRRLVGRPVKALCVRRSSALICTAGGYTPRVLGGKLVRGKPVFYVGNPVPPSFWSIPADTRPDNGLVLSVGDVGERKNTLGLVRAFGQVARRHPTARLLVAGRLREPDYTRRVEAEVVQQGIADRVVIPGNLDEHQVRQAYADCAVVALASNQETAPMALAQGLAAGRPVVATAVGGVRWMVDDGVTGYVVAPGDTPALADHLHRLLSDVTLRRHMGQAAREAARARFWADAVAEQTVQAYRTLLGSSGSSAR